MNEGLSNKQLSVAASVFGGLGLILAIVSMARDFSYFNGFGLAFAVGGLLTVIGLVIKAIERKIENKWLRMFVVVKGLVLGGLGLFCILLLLTGYIQ